MDSQPSVHPHHHAVQFYGNDISLFTTVAGFLAQGLVDAQPAILIATPSHVTAILDHLSRRLIDVEQAQRVGDLVILDASDTLALFMTGDAPDADRFEASVGRVIGDVLKGRPARTLIRAYGEMVDVLWKDGKADAAIRLEMLWNMLATRYGFALLCGYAMGAFYKQTDRFEEVCRQHTHVVPPDTPIPAPRPIRRVQ
jgi:MEDS: MEthanogen/methylotroph, DcmR Sensory domain